ncbi:MAG: hypothetical protein ACPLXL_00445 [Minisyncoccia bacterium]
MKTKELVKKIFSTIWWHLLIIGILVILIFFIFKDIQKQIGKNKTIKQEIYNQEMALTRVETLEAEWKKAEDYYKKLLEVLPAEKDLIQLEEKIKNLKNQCSVNLDFRFGSLNTLSNEPKSYNYSLTFTGPQAEVLKCLKSFQDITPAIRLEQIEFRPISSEQNKDQIELKALGRVYIR